MKDNGIHVTLLSQYITNYEGVIAEAKENHISFGKIALLKRYEGLELGCDLPEYYEMPIPHCGARATWQARWE